MVHGGGECLCLWIKTRGGREESNLVSGKEAGKVLGKGDWGGELNKNKLFRRACV